MHYQKEALQILKKYRNNDFYITVTLVAKEMGRKAPFKRSYSRSYWEIPHSAIKQSLEALVEKGEADKVEIKRAGGQFMTAYKYHEPKK